MRTLSMQSRMKRPWLKLGVTMENFTAASCHARPKVAVAVASLAA